MTQQRFYVQDDAENQRYVLVDTTPELNEALAAKDIAGPVGIGLIDYVDVPVTDGNQRVLFHTEVSPDYAGQGLASQLAQGAVDDVVANGYSIVPVCPYVAGWLPKHPEYAENTVAPTDAHIDAVVRKQTGR